MATVIRSNNLLGVNNNTKNIFDYATDAESKKTYVTDTLRRFNKELPSNIDALALFGKLEAHINMVKADGGKVLSYPHTLKALAFKESYLTGIPFNACSPAFGVKLDTSGDVTRIYGINNDFFGFSNRSLKVSSYAGEYSLISDYGVLNFYKEGGRTSPANGIILGQKTFEERPSTNSSYISSPRLLKTDIDDSAFIGDYDIANYTPSTRMTSNRNGSVMKHTAIVDSINTDLLIIERSQDSSDNTLKNIVFLTSVNSTRSLMYIDGEVRYTSSIVTTETGKSYRLEYLINNSKAGHLFESWFIDSNNETIAEALSNHLS